MDKHTHETHTHGAHTHADGTTHSHSNPLIGVYGAIAGAVIISLLGTYLIIQNQKIDELGGRENYKMYRQIIKNPKNIDTNKQSLEAAIKQLEGKAGDTAPSNNPSQPAAEPKMSGTLTKGEVADLTKSAYIKGNKSAEILWIEYSDLECPFCKRLHDSGVIKNMEKKYGSKLAVSFKHYPLPFHTQAIPAALTAECVGEAGGSDKYFAFIEGVFKKGTPTQETMESTINELGLNTTTIKSCVDTSKFKSVIDANMSEGSSKFSVNGTPGNVIINTKTGKYTVVSGAQPEANFQAAIESILK